MHEITQNPESPSKVVDRTIREEKQWLESEGIVIVAELLFGSVQNGNIKDQGESDVDVYLVTPDENWPNSIGGQELLKEDEPGHHFAVETSQFPPEVGVSHIKYHVGSPERVLSSLDKVKSILDETRPLDQVVTYESEGNVRTATVEQQLREQTWIYQVFKTGQIMSGEIPQVIQDKVKEIDEVIEAHRQRLIQSKKPN